MLLGFHQKILRMRNFIRKISQVVYKRQMKVWCWYNCF